MIPKKEVDGGLVGGRGDKCVCGLLRCFIRGKEAWGVGLTFSPLSLIFVGAFGKLGRPFGPA